MDNGSSATDSGEPDKKRLKELIVQVSESVALASQGDLGPAFGVVPFAKIQVLWDLSRDGEDEDQAEETWWPATVIGRTRREHDLPKPDAEEVVEPGSIERFPVYEIRYDPMPPDFPNPEIGEVCILGEHHLLNASDDETLPWRMVGSTWKPEEEDGSAADADEDTIPNKLQEAFDTAQQVRAEVTTNNTEASPQSMSSQEATNEAEAFVDKFIQNLVSKHVRTLQTKPTEQQQAIVDKIRNLKHRLVTVVAIAYEEKGFVSEADMQNFIGQLGLGN